MNSDYIFQKVINSMEEDDSHSHYRIHYEWNPHSQQNIPQFQSKDNSQPTEKIGNSLDTLKLAKQRFIVFMGELGSIRDTHIRDDILRYCALSNKSEKMIEHHTRATSILQKIQSRIQKMFKTKKIKKNWGEEDLKILIWVISKYCELKQIPNPQKQLTEQDWRIIASVIPGVTSENCMFKWLSLKKVTLAYHNWTEQESKLLREIVNNHIQREMKHCSEIKEWKEISQELYARYENEEKCYRNAKQCREHWTCYLSPRLKKGPWKIQEDVKLFQYIRDNKGSKKWSQMVKNFEGRTQNALKNRYNLLIDKQKKVNKGRHKSQMDLVSDYLHRCQQLQLNENNKIQLDDGQSQPANSSQQNDQQNYEAKTPTKKEESKSTDMAGEAFELNLFPSRIQKINFQTFQSKYGNTFSNIQPGRLLSDGRFHRIQLQSFQKNSADFLLPNSQEATQGLRLRLRPGFYY